MLIIEIILLLKIHRYLHRKETFVTNEYPNYRKFVKLTSQEEKLGLLTNPISIGTKEKWEERLKDSGVIIKNHQAKLVKK